MRRVGRRGFLVGAVGVATAVVVAPVGWVSCALAGSATTSTPAEKLTAFFADAEATANVGFAYLAGTPEEADANVLFAALTPFGQVAETWWASVELPDLRRRMRAATHADFADGNVVDLEGWQLARTECRLAALFTLTR